VNASGVISSGDWNPGNWSGQDWAWAGAGATLGGFGASLFEVNAMHGVPVGGQKDGSFGTRYAVRWSDFAQSIPGAIGSVGSSIGSGVSSLFATQIGIAPVGVPSWITDATRTIMGNAAESFTINPPDLLPRGYTRPNPTFDRFDVQTWDVMTNQSLDEMHFGAAHFGRLLVNRVEDQLGIRLRITQGLRTIEQQNVLFSQGRTAPGDIVTNAQGGQSYHNYGLAFDVAGVNENGLLDYNIDWEGIGQIANDIGLEWGGNWTNFIDRPHFQRTYDLSIRRLMQIHNIRLNTPIR